MTCEIASLGDLVCATTCSRTTISFDSGQESFLAIGLSSAYDPQPRLHTATGAVVHWGFDTARTSARRARTLAQMSLIEYVGDSEDEPDNVSRIYWAPPLPILTHTHVLSTDVGEAVSPSSLIEYVGDSEEESDNVSRIYLAPPLPRMTHTRMLSMDVGESVSPSSPIPYRPSKRRRVLSPSPKRNPSSSKTSKTVSSSKTAPTAFSSKVIAASSSKEAALSSFDAKIDIAKTRKGKSTTAPNARPHIKPKKSKVHRRKKSRR